MFKKTAIVAGVALAVSAAAQAEDYRWEIEGDYSHGEYEIDGFDDTEFDKFSVDGSFYLDSVNTNGSPLSEAAFLDQASDISLAYSYAEIDDNGIDVDGDTYGISGRYVTDSAGWIFDGSYKRLEPLDGEIDTWSVGVGKYLTDHTTLVLTYWNGDADEGGDTDGGAIGLKHFFRTADAAGFLVEANYGLINVDDADDVDIYNLSGTWFPNQNWGIGASYGRYDGFDGLINSGGSGLEVDQYSLFAEWFITQSIGVNLAYTYGETDDIPVIDTEIESNAITLGGRFRF